MTAQTCHLCHRQIRDGYVCHDCTKQAADDLRTIAYLLDESDAKRARRGAIDYRTTGVSRPREAPLPFDPRVTKVTDPVRAGLRGTFQIVCEGRGWHHDDGTVRTAAACATWLVEHLPWLRGQPEGAEEMAWFDKAARSLQRLYDRPPDRLYLGTCGHVVVPFVPCPEHVYVERTRHLPPAVECRCGASINVSERREFFADAVALYQATMHELVTLGPMFLTESVSRRTLQEWTRHGLLLPVGERVVLDLSGRWQRVPTYRIGDLVPARDAWAQLREDRRDTRRGRARASA